MTRAEQLRLTATAARAARIGANPGLAEWLDGAWQQIEATAADGRQTTALTLPQELAPQHQVIADTLSAEGLQVSWPSDTHLRVSW